MKEKKPPVKNQSSPASSAAPAAASPLSPRPTTKQPPTSVPPPKSPVPGPASPASTKKKPANTKANTSSVQNQPAPESVPIDDSATEAQSTFDDLSPNSEPPSPLTVQHTQKDELAALGVLQFLRKAVASISPSMSPARRQCPISVSAFFITRHQCSQKVVTSPNIAPTMAAKPSLPPSHQP